jgi:hypothetical protein
VYNKEGGDLNGVEIRLIPTRKGVKAVSWERNGGVPGGTEDTGCHGGAVLSVSGKADIVFGPFGGAWQGGVERNYATHESDWFTDKGPGLGWEDGGLRASVSIGGQVTLYRGLH